MVWELRLKGDSFVLNELASSFCDYTLEVKEVGGKFFLMSSEFEKPLILMKFSQVLINILLY
jgi:hypothetical protein